MARPWPKRSAWPYRCKSGRKSYTVGFYDHDRRERCRTFSSVRHARAWMDDYVTAERRGWESLRRFLLDLDAKEANEREERSIGAVLELYLQVNAHPRNEGGLAPTTYERYESIVNHHLLGRRPKGGTLAPKPYAVAVAAVPAVSFNGPQAPRAWREQMVREGVSQSDTRARVACALGRPELGRRVEPRARDRDQRVQPGDRAARQQAPLAARRGHRLHPCGPQ